LQLAKENADIILYRIGLDHNLNKAQVDRMSQEQRNAKFTEEVNRRIAESLAKIIELEGNYYAEVRKNATKIIALKEQIHKDQVDKLFKEADAQSRASQAVIEKAIQNVREEVITGNKLRSDGDKEILELKKRNAAQLIQIQIDAFEKIKKLNILNAEETEKLDTELLALRVKLNEALYDQVVELKEGEVEIHTDKLADLVALYTDFTNTLNGLFQTFTDNRIADIDRQLEHTQEFYGRQIEMAGDNTERRKELENELALHEQELERKRIQALRRAAIFDKIVSLTQAAINTALAVTNQLKSGDPYTAFARAVAAGVAGAIQIAAIAAKQIPQYWKGGFTKQEEIIAGELGHELYRTPQGKIGMTPGIATVMKLPVGTQIINAKETQRLLAMAGISGDITRFEKDGSGLEKELMKGIDKLINITENKPAFKMNVSKRGVELMISKADAWNKYLNDKFK
jgi:hypothetical protein